MPSIGRNDPCPCGSGKKYKQCHGPIDAERAAALRKLKQAPDTLWPKLMDSLDRFGTAVPATLSLFWNDAYRTQDIQELDQREDRGSERFLTWFAFDTVNEEGQTPVEQLTADPEGLELTEAEAQVLAGWKDVRLQPYEIVEVRKGQGMRVRPLFGETLIDVEDHAASKRLQAGEVLITHLVPAADTHFIAGAAAHLTPDTVDKLREFAEVHLQDVQQAQPDATYDDLIRSRSYIFNHFVMALPREEHDNTSLNELVARTRATLSMTAEQIGFKGGTSEAADAATDRPVSDAETVALDVDADVHGVSGLSDTSSTLESGGAEAAEQPSGTDEPSAYQGQDD
ncbi:MAG TPA: SEC-C domain-containing protein [Herpetosiphonaceae bacterium]